ncbi:MAG TPA: AAA family ATPase, partial [Myxococcales bacterium]|nr:AAA family ATPase [Myxococcales bacterium]
MAKRASEPRTDLRRLTTLQEISHVLSHAGELRHSLERALEKLERDAEAVRSAVMVLGEDNHEIAIEASVGISAEG